MAVLVIERKAFRSPAPCFRALSPETRGLWFGQSPSSPSVPPPHDIPSHDPRRLRRSVCKQQDAESNKARTVQSQTRENTLFAHLALDVPNSPRPEEDAGPVSVGDSIAAQKDNQFGFCMNSEAKTPSRNATARQRAGRPCWLSSNGNHELCWSAR